MLDTLEKFMNRLSGMDWGWQPLLSLRPPKEQEMDNRLLLKLSLFYGSIIGLLFLLVVILAAVEALNAGDILLVTLVCLPLGWALAFLAYKTGMAWAWNRRARRYQECDLCVEIYRLRREAGDWVIDEKQPVAAVLVQDGRGNFEFHDRSREDYLRKLFNEPATAYRGGGTDPHGVHYDAFVSHPAWTREAIELIISDLLRGQTLGGKIITKKQA